jgi:hypothetical protein
MKNRFQNLPFEFQLAALHLGKERKYKYEMGDTKEGLCRLNQVYP